MNYGYLFGGLLAGVEVADGVTTYIILKNGGVETNPLMKWLAKSPLALMLVKIGIGFVLGGLVAYLNRDAFSAGAILFSGFNGAIVWQNVEQIKNHK